MNRPILRFSVALALSVALVLGMACSSPTSGSKSGTTVTGTPRVLSINPNNGYGHLTFPASGTSRALVGQGLANTARNLTGGPTTPYSTTFPTGYPGTTTPGGSGNIISGPPN